MLDFKFHNFERRGSRERPTRQDRTTDLEQRINPQTWDFRQPLGRRALEQDDAPGRNLRGVFVSSEDSMRIATLMVALLAGCAALGGGIGEATGSWDGATYDEVVLRWGAPARSTKLTDGRDVYTWVSESAGSRGSSAVGFGIGSGGGGISIRTRGMVRFRGREAVRCERTADFQNRRVAEPNWRGPARRCRACA